MARAAVPSPPPLFVRSEEAPGALEAALVEPRTLAAPAAARGLSAGEASRPEKGGLAQLKHAVAVLQQRHPELSGDLNAAAAAAAATAAGGASTAAEPLLSPWARARQLREERGSCHGIPVEQLVALQLAAPGSDPDFLTSMNRFLFDFQPGTDFLGLKEPWETFVGYFAAGLASLRGRQPLQRRAVCAAWVSHETFAEHLQEEKGICFCGAQPCTVSEPWHLLDDANSQDRVPCILDFESSIAASAANVSAVAGNGTVEDILILPPYTRGVVQSVRREQSPGGQEVFRVKIEGFRRLELLHSMLEAPMESVLAGTLLLGLHTSEPGRKSALLSCADAFYKSLALSARSRGPEAATRVWRSYIDCARDQLHSFGELKQSWRKGIFSLVGLAAVDAVHVAKSLAGRALGLASSVDYQAMRREEERLAEVAQGRRHEAVESVREQVQSYSLETLSDPDAFLRFVELDPSKAFEAVPAAALAYLDAEAAQRVLLLAKLTALASVAAALIRGDEKVALAFDSPFPLRMSAWDAMFSLSPGCIASANLEEDEMREEREVLGASDEFATRALGLLQLQRLHLARSRLLLVCGALDVGKTTLVKEAFGFKHLAAGLSRDRRTEESTFLLHPDCNENFAPVYIVDTPGFGDGEQLHRNDFGRVMTAASTWLRGGVTVLWVIRAGRRVRQASDDFLRRMIAAGASLVVVVTHVDKLFEDHYREVGPRWREGCLQGVPASDERWKQKRRELMAELHNEVLRGVAEVVGSDSSACGGGAGAGDGSASGGETTASGSEGVPLPKTVYACLGGWMVADDDDDFAPSPPWPWMRQELETCFGVMGPAALRAYVDGLLGLAGGQSAADAADGG